MTFALVLPSLRVPSHFAGPLIALYWAQVAIVLAWVLFVVGRGLWRVGQVVAILRLRRALAMIAPALIVAAVLFAAPTFVAAQEPAVDLPTLPAPPAIAKGAPFTPPTPIFLMLPPDVDPWDFLEQLRGGGGVTTDAVIDCDWFPFAWECWVFV